MKIKHWQGCGCVNASVVARAKGVGYRMIDVFVSGNHEWGIHLEDKYDVFRWLGRFLKDCKDYRDIYTLAVSDYWNEETHTDEAYYHIVYKTEEE